MKFKFKYKCIGWLPNAKDNSQCAHINSDKTCKLFANHICDVIEKKQRQKQQKQCSPAQKWQRERFRAKGSLTAFRTTARRLLKSNILTASEMSCVKTVEHYINLTLAGWDLFNSISKHIYLTDSHD